MKDISEKILYMKEREISPERFVAQRVKEGRGVGSLRATPIERWCGDETLRGRENQPELRETKLW